jgi:hypothetical protein
MLIRSDCVVNSDPIKFGKNVFNSLNLENVDKGYRCGVGTARRRTPSREKGDVKI